MPRTHEALAARPAFAQTLKNWRDSRKLSQLDLAMAAGISQRHLSFLEVGRARPSRQMVLQLANALDAPLREHNVLLAAAGFAPLYRESALSDPGMSAVRQALELMLKYHEPNPALVVDRAWNLLMVNDAVNRVFGLAGDLDAIWKRVCPTGPRNILKLTLHPEGFRPYIANWLESTPVLIARTRREAEATGSEALRKLLEEVLAYPGIPAEWRIPQWDAPPLPAMPLSLAKDGLKQNLFSMMSTYGTPQDITTDELPVETFFPADADSALLLKRLAESTR